MKYVLLLSSLLLSSCATKGVKCEDYLSSEKEPVLLQRSADFAKPSKLPQAFESSGKCNLAETEMTIVKVHSDYTRFKTLGRYCVDLINGGTTMTVEQKQTCDITIFLYQCLAETEEQSKSQ